MIEKTVLDYLSLNLAGIPVFMQVPPDPPEEFVVVEKNGSGKINHIFSAIFALQSYGSSLLRAAEINEEVKRIMDDIVVLGDVASAKLNSDYNFTDPRTKRPRYQAVYDIVHY